MVPSRNGRSGNADGEDRSRARRDLDGKPTDVFETGEFAVPPPLRDDESPATAPLTGLCGLPVSAGLRARHCPVTSTMSTQPGPWELWTWM